MLISSREARNRSPLQGEAALAGGWAPQCPGMTSRCRHCPGLYRARALQSLTIPHLTLGRRTPGTGLMACSPSHTWLTFWSRHQSWFESNSASWKATSWALAEGDLARPRPTHGRTLHLQSPHPRGRPEPYSPKDGKRPRC